MEPNWAEIIQAIASLATMLARIMQRRLADMAQTADLA
jgi:hypothetical protein